MVKQHIVRSTVRTVGFDSGLGHRSFENPIRSLRRTGSTQLPGISAFDFRCENGWLAPSTSVFGFCLIQHTASDPERTTLVGRRAVTESAQNEPCKLVVQAVCP